ncbi:oxidoreductase NAD-binding domain-containing protein 1-like [Hyalella azteca]|uniref:Oxidoreductase NAD-binding domain-containing protein 1-like n=1 Tax=Hyalella azteca TaxID=294128 RepID=A0A979FW72_HYAAZ|nr:oxidoreductase NAD-binding domain-containing protein 1-like [Hyalella azteca]
MMSSPPRDLHTSPHFASEISHKNVGNNNNDKRHECGENHDKNNKKNNHNYDKNPDKSNKCDENHDKNNTEKYDNKHLRLTAGVARAAVLAAGAVTRVWQESPSVVGCSVAVGDPLFRFKAGQWVDVHIPGVDVVGGFSLCCAPHQFAGDGHVTLGIQRSNWPPANWFHQQGLLEDLCRQSPSLQVMFFTTRDPPDPSLSPLPHKRGRIARADLLAALDHLTRGRPTPAAPPPPPYGAPGDNPPPDMGRGAAPLSPYRTVRAFVCGPPAMIRDVTEMLAEFGVPEDQILFEKWW